MNHDHPSAASESLADFFTHLFRSDFMPHGHCYLWKPELIWLHVLSDAAIGLAYYSIPVMLLYFMHRKRDLPFTWIFGLFGAFIFWCGTTHLMNIWTLWHGTYRFDGVLKAMTAGISVWTAILLFPLIPKVLALRSPRELEEANRKLADEANERRKAEDEVRRLNASLERRVAVRTAELEGAVKELEAFSYSVSHDLRAPIRAINGFARILKETSWDALPPDGQRHVSLILQNVRNMGELVDDLLSFSRLGQEPIQAADLDMRRLVDEVVDEMKKAKAMPEAMTLQVGELPPAVGDRKMIKRVLVNLLSNAVKFSSKSERPVVRIEGSLEGKDAHFVVIDNGVGFEMQYADKLFRVFHRLHTQEEYEGTGVGLAIVHRIVSRHGGRVWGESELGRGAKFTFTLPRDRKEFE